MRHPDGYMLCNRAFPHRISFDADGKCNSLRIRGEQRTCVGQELENISLPVRERRCIFEVFDLASFEAAILELSLEFAEVIDDDMSDLYVQLIMGQPNQVSRSSEGW
jgi:hypothetical protein